MKSLEFIILSIFVLFLGVITFVTDIFPEGNKDLRAETRWAEGFDQISSSGDYKVIVKHGDNYQVEVKAESNLLPYIETVVVDHTLKIKTRGLRNLLQNYPIEVFITTPVLRGLFQSGSGMIKTGRFESEEFRLTVSGSGDIDTQVSTDQLIAHISGSGNIYLEGDAKEGRFVISGSGKIKSYQAQQRNCEAIIFGSGNMYVNTLETIDARISGSGKILYINNPIVSKNIYGSGDVFDMNGKDYVDLQRIARIGQ
ncbi:MAG TPA: head GIN domain-containing protein [Prolixibacteraceae bacterium]